ncbi:DUF1272 domain-containing protein [Micropruina sp.]|uniref:DUF1272 domain-containing protein n=1 Tax=Micropruina sp. TaxID=2737536 RepID=UPI0039E610D3
MLDYRHNCERCGRHLAADDHQVYICSFECTWCAACANTFPDHGCPNCGGNLVLRPIRPRHLQREVGAFGRLHSDCGLLVARSG